MRCSRHRSAERRTHGSSDGAAELVSRCSKGAANGAAMGVPMGRGDSGTARAGPPACPMKVWRACRQGAGRRANRARRRDRRRHLGRHWREEGRRHRLHEGMGATGVMHQGSGCSYGAGRAAARPGHVQSAMHSASVGRTGPSWYRTQPPGARRTGCSRHFWVVADGHHEASPHGLQLGKFNGSILWASRTRSHDLGTPLSSSWHIRWIPMEVC